MEVRPVVPEDALALGVLFAAIDTTHFHPHDMTQEGARTVAEYHGSDVYLIGWRGKVPVAYGMLRGWDEGYTVPSLGVAVRTGYRDRGYGRAVMEALHRIARAREAPAVRLRVAPHNHVAKHLYDSLGYRTVGIERGEAVMVLDLTAGTSVMSGSPPRAGEVPRSMPPGDDPG